jgi:hypothetical protein
MVEGRYQVTGARWKRNMVVRFEFREMGLKTLNSALEKAWSCYPCSRSAESLIYNRHSKLPLVRPKTTLQ